MADFIIRVELLGSPTGEVYKTLHSHMATLGFTETVSSTAGGIIILPHATYQGSSNQPVATLSSSIRDSIQTTIWAKAKVLAIKYDQANQADPT